MPSRVFVSHLTIFASTWESYQWTNTLKLGRWFELKLPTIMVNQQPFLSGGDVIGRVVLIADGRLSASIIDGRSIIPNGDHREHSCYTGHSFMICPPPAPSGLFPKFVLLFENWVFCSTTRPFPSEKHCQKWLGNFTSICLWNSGATTKPPGTILILRQPRLPM